MSRRHTDSTQVALRVPRSWLKAFDDAAKLISIPGFEATRADAMRSAMVRGLAEITRDHGPK